MTHPSVCIGSNELCLFWKGDHCLRKNFLYLKRSSIGWKTFHQVHSDPFLAIFSCLRRFSIARLLLVLISIDKATFWQLLRQLLYGVCYTRYKPSLCFWWIKLGFKHRYYKCFKRRFDVWSEKLLKNAPKKMCFLRRFFIKVLVEINYFLIAIICYFFRCGFYEIFKSSLGVFRFFI